MIGAFIPSNATTGLIEITTPGGIFISTNNFLILPKVYSFSPNIGAAGTVVTIDGTSLSNVTSVEFGGVATSPLTVTTNQVTVAVPGNAASGPITVVTQYGSSASTNSFTATKSSHLLLKKTVLPVVATVGSDITYTLTVTNEGPSITTDLIVTDSVPGNLTIISSNASVGTIVAGVTNLLWTFPILSNSASATARVVATTSLPGEVTNIANLGFAEGNLDIDDNFAYAIMDFVTAAQETVSVMQVSNAVVISWPVSGAGFELQVSTNLEATNGWQTLESGSIVTNGINYYTNMTVGPTVFYRLFFP
jgi:uncharacterized repeat protein (TIGR01451 family)